MPIEIRQENTADGAAITLLTQAAFRRAAHSSHTEHLIVEALRTAGALSVSLVAEQGGELLGHVAVSPVRISDGSQGWYGLGPLSVLPAWQGQGIGSRLMAAALASLRAAGASGCVLLGDPGFYARFGFRAGSGLVLPGVPQEFFQALRLAGPAPRGTVAYHSAFGAGA